MFDVYGVDYGVLIAFIVQVFLPKPLTHWDKFNVLRVQVNYFDLMGFKSHDLRDVKNFGGCPRFWEPQIFNPNADKGDFWEIKFSISNFCYYWVD